MFEGSNVLDNPANNAPFGTGPYRFVQYERGQYIIAERNPTYWRKDLPYLDRIVWRVITDKSAAAASLESGQIQISPYNSLPLADLDQSEGRPALRHLDTRPGSERFQQYAGIQHPPQGTVRRAGAPRDRARDQRAVLHR